MSDAIIYRTDDNTRWGTGKGGNLLPAEVDRNFFSLSQQIEAVGDDIPLPKEIADIQVVGNQMTIVMSDLTTTFGPYTLPVAAFNWTGDFQPSHDYKAFDLLVANDILWMVLVAYTSGPSFVVSPNNQMLFPMPRIFDVGFSFPNRPGFGIEDEGAMFSYLSTKSWYLLEDAPGSLARLRVAPADAVEYEVYVNDTLAGTVDFAASATTGTFTFSETQITPGDVLRVIRPATLDPDARDLNITFAGRIGTL